MKTKRFLLIVAGLLIMTAGLSGQTITEYTLAYVRDYYQTQDGSTASGDLSNQGNTNAYGFFGQVTGTGLSGTYSFTAPSGSEGTTNISTVETGALVYENAFAYADTTALYSAFGQGDYSMAIPNTNGVPQSVTGFSLTGDAFPDVPEVTGATWSGGNLLMDPTQNFTLNFSSFSSFGAGDFISLSIDNYKVSSTTAVTSFLIPAGSFTLAYGNTTSAELEFINIITEDGSSIAGADGQTGYVSVLSFSIQAIPEPSTYAAIFGGLALLGVIVHRRRRQAA